MAVYVDTPRAYDKQVGRLPSGTQWCHLWADTHDELEQMARRIGLRPSWIQHAGRQTEHYDLVPSRRAAAITHGAIEMSYRDYWRAKQ